jgi:MFS family permease
MPREKLFTTRLMTALMCAEVLSAFEISMLYAAVRQLVADFGDPVVVGWIITSFLLMSAVAAAICGRLGDMFGRQRLLLFIVSLSIVGSLIAGFAGGVAGVILGRVVQGTSGAIYPLCVGLIRENTGPKSTPILVGLLAASMTVSGGIGIVIGGVLVDYLSWRWIFFTGALAGILALVLVYAWVPRSKPAGPPRGTNFLGGVLFAPAIVLFLLAIHEVPRWGLLDARTLGTLGGALVLLAGWVYSELHARSPLINVRLLVNRQAFAAYAAIGIVSLGAFQFLLIWSLLLQQPDWTGTGLGLSATTASLLLVPANLVGLVASPGAGWGITRFGSRAVMACGGLILTLTWAILTWKHDTVLFVLVFLTLQGVGMNMVLAAVPVILCQAVPVDRTSEAIGMLSVFRAGFMGIGAQVVAFLLATTTVLDPDSGASFPAPAAYDLTLGYVTAGSLLIIVVSVLLSAKRTVPDTAAPEATEPAVSPERL